MESCVANFVLKPISYPIWIGSVFSWKLDKPSPFLNKDIPVRLITSHSLRHVYDIIQYSKDEHSWWFFISIAIREAVFSLRLSLLKRAHSNWSRCWVVKVTGCWRIFVQIAVVFWLNRALYTVWCTCIFLQAWDASFPKKTQCAILHSCWFWSCK